MLVGRLPQEDGDGRGEVRQTKIAVSQLIACRICSVVDEYTRDGVGGVGGFGLPCFIKQLFGIAVVGRNQGYAAKLIDFRDYLRQSQINRLERNDRWLHFAKN